VNDPVHPAALRGLALDHLVVACADLAEGVAWCERTLGHRPQAGGRHAFMGTHNRILSIGSARFPRAYLDANRAPGELDPAMFDEALAVPIDSPGPRVNAGLGVIPRVVRDGAEIYSEKLPAWEAEERLSRLYRPYHAALARMLEETRARFGCAVLIDCHSMPSAAAIPDAVLGDRYGMSASHALMRRAEHDFERHGFNVARNTPYAGGYSTHIYGRPMLGHHALQIEINRALYLDEERIQPNARFGDLANRISDVLRDLTSIEPALLRPASPRAWAAE